MKAEREHGWCLDGHTPSSNPHGDGLSILLVEDDRDNAESMVTLLGYFGHRVRVAFDGSSACQAALRHPPDVVLFELALPDMDGWAVAHRLKGAPWDKRPLLIALTGCGSNEDRRRSGHIGIDLHLVKPVDPDLLRGVLARFYRVVMPTQPSSAGGTTAESWQRRMIALAME